MNTYLATCPFVRVSTVFSTGSLEEQHLTFRNSFFRLKSRKHFPHTNVRETQKVLSCVLVCCLSSSIAHACAFSSQPYNQTVIGWCFLVISGIIKVALSVISRAEGRGWYYLPWPRLFRILQKLNLIIVLLYVVLKIIATNTPSQGTELTLFLEILHCARNL